MRHQSFLRLSFALGILFGSLLVASTAPAQKKSEGKSCFTQQARENAERTAKVYSEPDPDYDPVLGYSKSKGPRQGSPPVDENGMAKPINCVANRDPSPGS